jgi:hypothetical protein
VIFQVTGNRGLQMAGRAGAMSDSDAINVMDPELALSCAQAGQHEVARFILPWAMLQMAVRSENVQRTARLELLEVAFAGFSEMMKSHPETGATKGVSQRNDDGVPLTFARRTC